MNLLPTRLIAAFQELLGIQHRIEGCRLPDCVICPENRRVVETARTILAEFADAQISDGEFRLTTEDLDRIANTCGPANDRNDMVMDLMLARYMLSGDVEFAYHLESALRGIMEIGKRDMTNPKYDGYFDEAREILAVIDARRRDKKQICEDCQGKGYIIGPEDYDGADLTNKRSVCKKCSGTGRL